MSEWKHLHILVIVVELRNQASIRNITEFLTMFRPPTLRDVTVQFGVDNREIIYAWSKDDAAYIDTCLKFEAALSEFPQHRLSLLVSSKLRVRKHIWTHELGQLFSTFRDLGRLTVNCESSERSDLRISSI